MSVNDASGIIIDHSRVTLLIVASITDNSKGIIYNHNMFIEQATVLFEQSHFLLTVIDIKYIIRPCSGIHLTFTIFLQPS